MADHSIGDLVKARMAINDLISVANADSKKLVAEKKHNLEILDGFILKALNEMGMDSAKTEFGTASKDTKESFTVEDRQAFFDWIIKHDAWHFVPAKINAVDARTYMKENDGVLPPGIKYGGFTVVKFRKPTKKAK